MAAVYLLCVLAPALSFAAAGERWNTLCLSDSGIAGGTLHIHLAADDGHVHGVQPQHPHGHDAAGAGSLSAEEAALSPSSNLNDIGHHKGAGQCCDLACVSAIPAMVADIASPSVVRFVPIFEKFRTLADGAPLLHYRPPIAS